jgi:DNA adenine methylase
MYRDAEASNTYMSAYLDAYRERIPPSAHRLLRVQLECRPALDVIADYGRVGSNLIYADPPYVASTRRKGAYLHELGEDDHVALAEALHGAAAMVAISGYRCPLYDRLYQDWRRADFSAYTQQANNGRNGRVESVWMNYDPPLALILPGIAQNGDLDGAVA